MHTKKRFMERYGIRMFTRHIFGIISDILSENAEKIEFTSTRPGGELYKVRFEGNQYFVIFDVDTIMLRTVLSKNQVIRGLRADARRAKFKELNS